MNYQELLIWGKESLKAEHKLEQEARVLLFYLLDWSAKEYLLSGQQIAKPEEIKAYKELIARRLSGVPLQEITGYQDFYGYPIQISKAVLTPRPETELLVELALKSLEGFKNPKVLDLCTGSGCIAIALSKENPGAKVYGLDISEEALDMARKNAGRNQTEEIQWIKSNLFENLGNIQFSLIISNPPYIKREEIAELDREVRDFDPHLALDGGEDGLDFYRQISAKASDYLVPAGVLCLEIGDGQAGEVLAILEADGFRECRQFKDYAGRERMIWTRRAK